MPNSLASPPVRDLLDRLFQAAEHDDDRRAGLAERHPGGLAGMSARDTISMAAQMADYLSYVRDPAHGYVSVAFPESDGLEISCRT